MIGELFNVEENSTRKVLRNIATASIDPRRNSNRRQRGVKYFDVGITKPRG